MKNLLQPLLLTAALFTANFNAFSQTDPTYIQRPCEPDGVHPIETSETNNNWQKGSSIPFYCVPQSVNDLHQYDWMPYYNPTDPNPAHCQDGTYFRMPFFRINGEGGNDNDDLFPLQPQGSTFQSDFIPDYLPTDGWELLHRSIGTPTTLTNYPTYIFYNKYQAKLRVFILINRDIGSAQAGSICIYFRDDVYASNLLSGGKQPSQALDIYSDSREGSNMLCQSFNWTTSPDTWVYADFPMTYDPCTCLFKTGELQIRLMLQTQSQINLGSSIVDKAITTRQITATTPSTDPEIEYSGSGAEQKGLSSFKELSASASELEEAINKFGDAQRKAEALAALNDAEGDGGSLNYLSLFSTGVGVVLSVSSFMEYLLGTTTEKGSSPPFMLTNKNTNLSGTITEQVVREKVNIPLPGSYETEQLKYNYPLGNFNVVRTPKIVCRRAADPGCYSFLGNLNSNSSQLFRDYMLTVDPLEVVINPWPEFDLTSSSIKVAIEVEHWGMNSEPHSSGSGINYDLLHRWEMEFPDKDFGAFKYVFSAPSTNDYHGTYQQVNPMQGNVKLSTYPLDLNNFTSQPQDFRLKWGEDHIPSWGSYSFKWFQLAESWSVSNHNEFTDGYHEEPPIHVYVKFYVNLVGKNGITHQVITRFKADVDYEGPFDRCPNGTDTPYMNDHIKPYYLETSADDNNTNPTTVIRHPSELPENLEVNFQNNPQPIYRALEIANISSDIIPLSGTVVVQASNFVTVDDQGNQVNIGPGTTLEIKNFTNPSGITGLHPLTRTQIESFCTDQNGLYRVPSRHSTAFGKLGDEENYSTQLISKSNRLTLSPNPAPLQAPIQVTGPEGAAFTLTTTLGETIPLSASGTGGNYQLRHSATAPGVYILTVTTDQGSQKRRIVLQ